MIRLFSIIYLIFLSAFSFADNPNYTNIFAGDYRSACSYILDNKNLIEQICNTYEIDFKLATSIVFPEIVRYSILKDFFETNTLKIFYTHYGKEYADFSVGKFQMKPSFIETLENYIQNKTELNKKYHQLIVYSSKDITGIRSERIERLQSLEWQIMYLCAFIDIIQILYHEKIFYTKEDQIKFYSAAYNCGFTRGFDEINKFAEYELFPYGNYYKGRQYSYSKISIYFYKNELLIL